MISGQGMMIETVRRKEREKEVIATVSTITSADLEFDD